MKFGAMEMSSLLLQLKACTMTFPLVVDVNIDSHNGLIPRKLTFHQGFNIILGPNGSGKTHLLRSLKAPLQAFANGKVVRFLSAGRMGMIEQFRSDYDGHRGGMGQFDAAVYGSKDDSRRRHKMETLTGDLQTLAARPDIQIKIQERMRKLFKRDILVDWDAGQLKVQFNRNDEPSQPYSSGREASGLMHMVGILSALYDDEVGVILIDEPEVSLHPQLQSFILREILNVAGQPEPNSYKKLVIVATHSTEMLNIRSVNDLSSIIFCHDLRSAPVQISPDEPALKGRKLSGLVARLGQMHKLSFFSTRPLLIEGASDSIICQALIAKLGLYPEAAGSQLLPVDGKPDLPLVAKLFRLMGKFPTALADADAFADGTDLICDYFSGREDVAAIAAKYGATTGEQFANTVFTKLAEVADKNWDDISAHAKNHSYWTSEIAEETTRKRRALLCTLFALNDKQLSLLQNGAVFVNLKNQVEVLFSMAEKCGLFFLRRGTIEDYFLGDRDYTSLGKPEAAVRESEGILAAEVEEVSAAYGDVLNCINYASDVEPICEAEAMQDILLSVVAPAQARMKSDDTFNAFNLLAKQTIGDRADLFDLKRSGNKLTIDVTSNILEIADSFPIEIGQNENVVDAVANALFKGG